MPGLFLVSYVSPSTTSGPKLARTVTSWARGPCTLLHASFRKEHHRHILIDYFAEDFFSHEFISVAQNQKMNNESLRALKGVLVAHMKMRKQGKASLIGIPCKKILFFLLRAS